MKELRSVEVLIQTVTQLGMNLFAFLETDIEENIVFFSEDWMPKKQRGRNCIPIVQSQETRHLETERSMSRNDA
ncbi:hypothetical protein DPMN_005396 [Dreissena polymorpha]|uniref:Uncharacterized protein n=1 Tax=Dreissena polymorpha TaxID=45954 RepID=A0A9D4MSL7_DREPO|nr:hypothetical protein DPMN_005396 [Dreissena polymorpha]